MKCYLCFPLSRFKKPFLLNLWVLNVKQILIINNFICLYKLEYSKQLGITLPCHVDSNESRTTYTKISPLIYMNSKSTSTSSFSFLLFFYFFNFYPVLLVVLTSTLPFEYNQRKLVRRKLNTLLWY